MSLKKSIIELSEKFLPGLAKQQQRKAEEGQQAEWFAEQKRRFETGDEIEPPWVSFPNSDPMTLWVSWRYGNHWLDTIWKPFWHTMNEKQQEIYLKKWQSPNDDWYKVVAIYWGEELKKE